MLSSYMQHFFYTHQTQHKKQQQLLHVKNTVATFNPLRFHKDLWKIFCVSNSKTVVATFNPLRCNKSFLPYRGVWKWGGLKIFSVVFYYLKFLCSCLFSFYLVYFRFCFYLFFLYLFVYIWLFVVFTLWHVASIF